MLNVGGRYARRPGESIGDGIGNGDYYSVLKGGRFWGVTSALHLQGDIHASALSITLVSFSAQAFNPGRTSSYLTFFLGLSTSFQLTKANYLL